ncbi:MAG: EAL domain-containing protein [Gammaproteobacteria bacterium]
MTTILVVDDNADNRDLLAAVLAPCGYRVLEAADGFTGLALARREQPRLIISDILMPAMDGYEFVQQLRADPRVAAIPVVFYSAWYQGQEAARLARDCGVEHLLTKPCEPEEIITTVAAALADTRPGNATKPAASGHFAADHARVVNRQLSRTAEQLEHANQRLLAFQRGQVGLASERDPERLLQGFVDMARELIGARYALAVAGFKHDGDSRKRCVAVAGLDADIPERLDGAALEAAFASRWEPAFECSYAVSANNGNAAAYLPGLPRARNLLVAPLRSPTHAYGWIGLADKLDAEGFDDDDGVLVATSAALAGRVYENGSLYARLTQHAATLEREVAERRAAEARVVRLSRIQAVLSSINGLIVRVRERDELFTETCRIAIEHGGFGSAWIGLREGVTQAVRPLAWAGVATRDDLLRSGALTPDDMPSGQGIIGQALRTLLPAWSNDLLAGIAPQAPPRAIAHDFRSAIALPLLLEGEAVGCVVLLAHERDFFNGEEIRLLIELAGDVSFALDYMAKAAQADYLAYYDALTGLPNRRLFLEHLAHAVHNALPGTHLVVILGDVQRFRSINETYGLAGGDNVLREIARRLLTWAHAPENLARVAANGFASFLAEVRDPTEIAHRVQQLAAHAVQHPIAVGDDNLHIGFALGAAVWPQDGKDAETLYRNAEAALAEAKAQATTFLFYERSLNERVADTLALEGRLRRALDAEHFVLHYQPKLSLVSGAIVGVEALVRWDDPDSGLVPPGRFIPLLEETGMILELGRWALSRAAHDYRAWQAAGLAPPPIAVNISALQLRHKSFLDDVLLAVDSFGDAAALELELTESMIMDDHAEAVRKLNIVRGLGVTIALDDFGTGYSSLAYVARLPVNMLKIDRSFISEMEDDPYCRSIVTMVNGLAHTLGLAVVAEGVETREQVATLAGLGCDVIQGYLVSRPLPAAACAALLGTGVPATTWRPA